MGFSSKITVKQTELPICISGLGRSWQPQQNRAIQHFSHFNLSP